MLLVWDGEIKVVKHGWVLGFLGIRDLQLPLFLLQARLANANEASWIKIGKVNWSSNVFLYCQVSEA